MEILTLVILHLWTGFVSVNPDTGWSPGLAVIRSDADYARFVGQIPRHFPGPASTDPMLKRPRVDFERQMIIAVTSKSPFTRVTIEAIERAGSVAIVRVRYTSSVEEHDTQQRVPVNFIGAYAAAEVDRFEGEIQIEPATD